MGMHGKNRNNGNRAYSHDQTNEEFINPYNFVSFPSKFERSDFKEGNLTGYLSVSLKTRSPIFIPNTTNTNYLSDPTPGHKTYDFYSYADLSGKTDDGTCYSPVIPGSEIRGLLRTIHEIQNDSCFGGLIDLDRTFAKRNLPASKKNNPDRKSFEPHFIFWNDEKQEYICYKAEGDRVDRDHASRMESNCFYDSNYGLVDDENLTIDDVSNRNLAYYRIGVKFDNKISKKLYVLEDRSDDGEPLTKEEVLCFKNVLEEYSDERINHHLKNKRHSGYKELKERFLGHKPIIAFICKENGFKMISPAYIGKYMSPNTLKSILKKRGYFSCSDIHESCPTCQLFGFINKDNNSAHSSRIRITDAMTDTSPDDCYLEWHTLKPLLSPHPSNALFYGSKNNDNHELDNWSYDGAICIRGRKMYFHSQSDLKENDIPSNLNVTIHPIKKDLTFSFKIYFDEITEEQLEQLLKCVNLYNKNGEDKYGHKIGYAKPVGFGSVFMKVEKVVRREITKKDGKIFYEEVNDETLANKAFDPLSSQEKQLSVMSDLSFEKEKICYPYAENDDNGYAWFTNNLSSDMYKQNKRQSLPLLAKQCKAEDVKERLKLKVNKRNK